MYIHIHAHIYKVQDKERTKFNERGNLLCTQNFLFLFETFSCARKRKILQLFRNSSSCESTPSEIIAIALCEWILHYLIILYSLY